jgi:hypothetical protein
MNLTQKDEERFWSKVDKFGECWMWTGSTREGYGLFRLNGRIFSAHRVSYQLAHPDETISGVQIRHSCDTPACVNPKHLGVGDAKANSDDKMLRDRHNFPLSNEQVLDIRSRPLSITMCRDLAVEFNVSPSVIKKILVGESYRWLGGARNIPEQFTGHKLTPEQVKDIAEKMKSAKYGDIKKLAEFYGVDRQTIAHIKYRRLQYTETL